MVTYSNRFKKVLIGGDFNENRKKYRGIFWHLEELDTNRRGGKGFHSSVFNVRDDESNLILVIKFCNYPVTTVQLKVIE